MNFLILGCNGMAGHIIGLYLKNQGHTVLGFAHSKSALINSVVGDVHDYVLLKNLIEKNRFDAIINCIGILNQECDNHKSEAVFINSYFPHVLVEITKELKTQIIHLSTDCVFSGNRGQYVESDFKDGNTFYDRTKALGEIDNNKDLTLRQSIVGPDINKNGIGLLNWFLQQSGDVQGFTGAIWTGQTTLQLAKTIEVSAKEPISGVVNAVPESSISKYELLELFNKYIRKKKVSVIPVDRINLNKSLKRTRWDFEYRIPDYEYMVSELGDWMRLHANLYPHYEL